MLRKAAQATLRNEIDNMSMNRNDETADNGWLDSIEETASRVGILGSLRSEIESERESISEYYYERRFEPKRESHMDLRLRSNLAPGRVAIDGLFQELV